MSPSVAGKQRFELAIGQSITVTGMTKSVEVVAVRFLGTTTGVTVSELKGG